jgi:ribose transport system permease protein
MSVIHSSTRPSPRNRLEDVSRVASRYGVYFFAAAVFVATCAAIPGFLSGASIRELLVLASILGIAAAGQTVAAVFGGLDLSIAPLIGLSSVLLAQLTGDHWSLVPTLAVIAAVAVITGLTNGLVSHFLAAPSLVVTLAVGSIVTGITLALNQGSAGGTIPNWVTHSVSAAAKTGGVPIAPVVAVWVLLSILGVLLQRRAPTFRRLYAAGTNPGAARLALISLSRMSVFAFVFSALAAALAGLFLGGFSGGADPAIGDPYLFLTVAAVVVGGTSLLGGQGGLGRTLVGAFVISNLTTLLLGIGINTNLQQVMLGLLIVLLVFAYGREQHVKERV